MTPDHSSPPQDDGPGRNEALPTGPDKILRRLADPMFRAWLEEALAGLTFPTKNGNTGESQEEAA
jgi:hypothetical protein